jgi:hypothetical protein
MLCSVSVRSHVSHPIALVVKTVVSAVSYRSLEGVCLLHVEKDRGILSLGPRFMVHRNETPVDRYGRVLEESV